MSEAKFENEVNEVIYDCLNLKEPKSFFLFAGAGSGKTRSLVEVLKKFREENIEYLRKYNQNVAVITYTNAACDEIKRRLEFDPSFHVSTIHSFAWDLIKPYTKDISECLKKYLEEKNDELSEKIEKAKNKETKTCIKNKKKLEKQKERLKNIKFIKKYIYNPNGENKETNSLNHTEVIDFCSSLIKEKSVMQNILIKKYPILLIDESQDTNKELINTFLLLQEIKQDVFSLGLFGDTMQRIYFDGESKLQEKIIRKKEYWKTPAKTENYRCPKRIIKLLNKIRSYEDGRNQEAKKELEGHVKIFLVDNTKGPNKNEIETKIFNQMFDVTHDPKWQSGIDFDVKILTLEHHMAAIRAGFFNLFSPLYKVNEYKTSLLDGSLPGLTFFIKNIIPLIECYKQNDKFGLCTVVKKNSPFFDKKKLAVAENPMLEIEKSNEAVKSLLNLFKQDNNPGLMEILKEIKKTNLFEIPDVLLTYFEIIEDCKDDSSTQEDKLEDEKVKIWESILKCKYNELLKYYYYINDESPFGTHQGIKGLEFPRVMVIIDDEEANGFMFSYEKLFGAKELSETDKKNNEEGKENSIDRTRRLFYVTCSRAEESLAIVAYTKNKSAVKKFLLTEGWFEEDEIIEMNKGEI